MSNIVQYNSSLDNSINYVEEQLTGFVESRYVRKCDDYFIAYLSSQTGCNRGCKFCHLTTTKQTKFENVPAKSFLEQARIVMDHYNDNGVPAKYIHYNFMARGEPLNNINFTKNADEVLWDLGNLAKDNNLLPKFNISTIIPRDTPSLTDIFKIVTPTIYYSIYSVDKDFRDKWMPNAANVFDALDNIKHYQQITKKIVKLHCAFIKGENDSDESINRMITAVKIRKIACEFNIVHYNPFSIEQGEESDQLDYISRFINSRGIPCKIIPRVGFDVKASCGLFVNKD